MRKWQLKILNYFHKKLHHRCLTGFGFGIQFSIKFASALWSSKKSTEMEQGLDKKSFFSYPWLRKFFFIGQSRKKYNLFGLIVTTKNVVLLLFFSVEQVFADRVRRIFELFFCYCNFCEYSKLVARNERGDWEMFMAPIDNKRKSLFLIRSHIRFNCILLKKSSLLSTLSSLVRSLIT